MITKKDLLLRVMQQEENLTSALWDINRLRKEVERLRKELDDIRSEAAENAEAAAKAEKAFSDGVSNILGYDYLTARRG